MESTRWEQTSTFSTSTIQVIPFWAGEDIRLDAISAMANSTADRANYEFREMPIGTFGPSNLFTGLSVGVHKF